MRQEELPRPGGFVLRLQAWCSIALLLLGHVRQPNADAQRWWFGLLSQAGDAAHGQGFVLCSVSPEFYLSGKESHS